MAGGERQILQSAMSLLMRLIIVLYFLYNIDQVIIWVFDIVFALIELINQGQYPWRTIDVLLGKLLGIGPSLAISQGIIGLLSAAMFSTTTGIFLFLPPGIFLKSFKYPTTSSFL